MDKIIHSNIEKYPLTGQDVMLLCKGKVNVMRYSDLENKSLDEILGQYRACIILIEYANQHVGHWVLLFEKPDKTFEYYNSFGYPIDYNYPKNPVLQKKLFGLRVIVNKNCLQSKKEDINTCGRYCVLRLNYRNISLESFNRLLTQNKAYTSDFWVSICSTNFLDF